MENSSCGTLLHPKIAKFYQINKDIRKNGDIPRFINADCTYNWTSLEMLLLGFVELEQEGYEFPKSYDEYLHKFELLEPVLHESQSALSRVAVVTPNDLLTFRMWLTKLQWLGYKQQLKTILQEHLKPTSQTSTVENVLFLTAALESSLANVYYTITKKTPPHLLRDLLDTKELLNVFGVCPILFLKIIMGSPNSVNLRNVVWHGFPLPNEVPSFYTATLLVLAASLFVLIKNKGLMVLQRHQINIDNADVCRVNAIVINQLLFNDVPRMLEVIKVSKWTAMSEHKVFWNQIIEHFLNDRPWQLVILILPQIELLLRRMYAEANNFDITAKLEEYYITMDTIFESKDNRLLNGLLTTGTLHFLYDIFMAPHGMRIRDKVSHGEVDLNSITSNLSTTLLYAGFNLITSNVDYTLDCYRSQYHLNVMALEWINSSKKAVLELMNLKTPDDYELEFNWSQESLASLQKLELPQTEDIFDRHKKEPEIMTMILRIAQHVHQVCANYKLSFEERFNMLAKRELRSRARKTLQRMVESMTEIGVSLEYIVQCIARLIKLMLGNNHEWFEKMFEHVHRFCKHTLKIVENMSQASDKSSNEWLNVMACCNMFQKVSTNFLMTVR